jgi:hypothetical protein
MFLFMFDFFSILERKNPLGLIRAFRQAFASGEGPTLVLKTINGGKRLNDLERLRASAADRPDILVIDEYYTSEQKNALLGLCDCYVSLHRSEGLGLTMAEAMGLGKPVIATGYSGNLHFMTGENSYLVDYAMSSVPADCYPYPKGSVWADPNLEHAAELMCRVYADRDEASARAARGRQHILTRHNVEISTAALTTRLEAIRRSRRYMRNLVEDAPTPVAVPPVAGPPAETPVATTRRVSRGLSLSFLSRVTRAGRNALTQGLRTYWRRRQRHALLLQNVRDAVTTITKASAVESQQRQALESVWTALHVLESRQQQQQAQIDATRKAVRRDRPVTGVNGPEPEERMAAFEDDRTPFGEAADAIRQTTAEP